MSINQKIREAWKLFHDLGLKYNTPNDPAVVLADAFVDAEARARMVDFMDEHDWHAADECNSYPERHNWTKEDWKAEVIAELNAQTPCE